MIIINYVRDKVTFFHCPNYEVFRVTVFSFQIKMLSYYLPILRHRRTKSKGECVTGSQWNESDNIYICNNFQASSKPVSCLISRAALLIDEQHNYFDICGLNCPIDTDSEEDSTVNVTDKLPNIGRSLFLKKRVNNDDIKQKFINLENEHKKMSLQMKSLQNTSVKKEQTVQELTAENDALRKKCDIMILDLQEKNTHLVEYASANQNLEKQNKERNSEISQLQMKLEKGALIQSNLLKDIDYYKSELNRYKEVEIHKPQDYEDLRKKFIKMKRDNANLEKKCKDLKLLDAENATKNTKHMIMSKRVESLQNEMLKCRMENKQLKEKRAVDAAHDDKQNTDVVSNCEKENNMLKETLVNYEEINMKLKAEIECIRQGNEQLENEIQNKNNVIQEMEEKLSIATGELDALKVNFESSEKQRDILQQTIVSYKEQCETLEKEVANLKNTNNETSKETTVFREDINQLKIQLGELLLEKDSGIAKTNLNNQLIQTDVERGPLLQCLNCVMLKKEVEKLGYANFKLNKEKTSLKLNFQKLSVKTSRLELKMDELNTDKNNNISILDHKSSRHSVSPDLLLQQNLILSKKLQDVVENYDKLLKDYICLQQDKLPSNVIKSSSVILKELQDHLCNSHFCIQSIENKLNTEEGKLNASLYHLRSVKHKLSERKMALKY